MAQGDARILLTKPVHREDRKTRAWILKPDEIAPLAEKLKQEG